MPKTDQVIHRERPALVNLQAAADHAGVSTRTIRRWIASGQLSAYRVGPKVIRVDLAQVETMFTPIGGRA